MQTELGLNTDHNYSRYVHLDRPFVSYAVSAAQRNALKSYTWKFPLIGSVPYKAYFRKERADQLAGELEKQGLDTLVRGVTAYSTLGWFEDPLLSTMLGGAEHSFINTLIHETVHANLYIKSQSQFNERVASYLGQLGAETYYKSKGQLKEFQELLEKENHDELLFSTFISGEIKRLRSWYEEPRAESETLQQREEQFEKIKQRFREEVLPKLKTDAFRRFSDRPLNNASLLLYGLYMADFGEFEQLANHYGRNFKAVFKALKSLESEEDAQTALTRLVQSLTKSKPASPGA